MREIEASAPVKMPSGQLVETCWEEGEAGRVLRTGQASLGDAAVHGRDVFYTSDRASLSRNERSG